MSLSSYHFDLVWYRCITPLHVGVGQEVGVVDLPIARERTTGFPVVPGSGIRGALRSRCAAGAQSSTEPGDSNDSGGPRDLVTRLFGSEDAERAGCLSVVDARILLFPVRASPGIMRWVTCPFVIERFERELGDFGARASAPSLPESPPGDSELDGAQVGRVFLEEYPFSQRGKWPHDDSWTPLGSEGHRSIVLINDEAFLHFVTYATILRTRNRLTREKTVSDGQLFSVEELPPETILYGFLGATDERAPVPGTGDPGEPPIGVERMSKEDALVALLRKLGVATGHSGRPSHYVVLGGDESVGSGVTQMTWAT